MRWGKLSRASVSHPLWRVQETFIYQRFAFPSPCELPSSASESQITTPKVLLCVELKMVFKVRLSAILVSYSVSLSSVQFSHSVMPDALRPHESQHARPPCPSPTPGVHSNSHPSSRWCHPAISSPLASPSPPAPNPSQHQSLFQWVNSSHEVAKVLEFQL